MPVETFSPPSQPIEGRGGCTIVGVGASAGGLEALESLFHALPTDSGMAFVVIQHLSPDFKSHMEELLARQTKIAIKRVESGVLVEPDTIYLIPPNTEMVISDGRLLLTRRSLDRSRIHPIDQFLQSLASDVGSRAVAVILSGTGSDGTRGIVDVHAAGGTVLVQDEASAKFDGMPASAMATGKVHLVLPPAAIAEALVRMSRDGVSREQIMEEESADPGPAGTDQITSLLNRKFGIDFAQYKAGTVGRRIARRVNMLGLDSIESYLEKLLMDDTELRQLYEDLLIGVTQFFRDPEAFEQLQKEVIVPLVNDDKKGTLRIWVAACATGEEAYSIAILFDEALREANSHKEVKIFATDAHSGSLQIAGKGVYPEEALSEMSLARRERYFTRANDGYHVTRALRNSVVFAAHNLICDAPFTQIDLITCRNMLIYLQPSAQRKTLSLFHFALNPFGTLFLGPSESPGEVASEFESLNGRWRIYRKLRNVRLPVDTYLPGGRTTSRLPSAPAFSTGDVLRTNHRKDHVDKQLAAYDQLLAHVMPCSLLVDEAGDVVHLFSGVEKYLVRNDGRPSNQLLDLVDTSLRSSISGAWHHALIHRTSVRNRTTFRSPHGVESLQISVTPLAATHPGPNNYLIKLESSAAAETQDQSIESDLETMHQSRIEGLETELRFSQENLQSALEEMETSNEELQSSNEELVAANEELQSTNEELHSVNEELYTVNAEHQRRVEELAMANDDMDNLLATTRVGVIFLDKDLYIRRFTPEIARVFKLDSQDTGRSIEMFASTLRYSDLISELRKVISSHQEFEVKVSDHSGNHFLLRAMPYRSGDATEGAVVTLVDICSLVDAEAEIHLQKKAIESAVNGIVITDPLQPDNPIVYTNRGFLDLTGYERDEVIGHNCRFLQSEETDPASRETIRKALEKGEAVRVALLNRRKDGTKFWNDLSITPVLDRDGRVVNFVGVQHDITVQVEVQQKLEEANHAAQQASNAKSSFLATMSHELRTPLTAVLGFADILRNESDDPQYVEKVDAIRRNGAYLLALLNDILDLSKIEAGKLDFGTQSIDVRAVLKEVEILMQVRAKQSRVPLRFRLHRPLPAEVTADEVRVRQIVVNLVSNAIKFTEKGEVVVDAVMIEADAVSKSLPRLEISVSDTGIGIDEAHLATIFTPFQSDPSRTRNANGAGLGLSISKRLAKGMGGTIRVESQVGKGSCFTLCLPVTHEQAENQIEDVEADGQPAKPARPSQFPRIRAKILLADDRRDIWKVGKHFLEKCGAKVTIAENGLQAVEFTDRAAQDGDPFELILMDMQMPIMDGRQAVSRIRQLGYQVPIIALTADAMDGERDACIAMGCNEYFPKPIDGLLLTNLIAEMLVEQSE